MRLPKARTITTMGRARGKGTGGASQPEPRDGLEFCSLNGGRGAGCPFRGSCLGN